METMNELGEYYYQNAVLKFKAYEYEEAVKYFIKAYEFGIYQKEIIDILYSCFILPNEEEFKKAYVTNTEGITMFPYEDTEIDFIPVSEERYYLFYKTEKKFLGSFDVGELGEREKNFHSILVADVWDVREIKKILQKYEYATVYYLLNEEKSKFFSFFKIPGFAKMYLENALCFENTQIMKIFFREYEEYYIPKMIVGKNIEYYETILLDISSYRKRNIEVERKNVFLTIAIPSYNRGHVLIKNVKHMLQMPYDSEIEILISDNGSVKNVEGYQEMQNIRDSRLKYIRVEENKGYMANVLNVLEHASGNFIMMASDEDVLIIEEMKNLLNKLYQNSTAGVVKVWGYGKNFPSGKDIDEERKFDGVNAVWMSMNTNYLTGIIFNKYIMRKYGILEKCYSVRENLYFQYYTHMVIAMFISQYAEFYKIGLYLWIEGESAEGEEIADENELLRYMKLESRIEQFDSAMDLIELMYGKGEKYNYFFINYLDKTYFYLKLARYIKKEGFEKLYKWNSVCDEIYQYSKEKIKKEGLNKVVEKEIDKLYGEYLNV